MIKPDILKCMLVENAQNMVQLASEKEYTYQSLVEVNKSTSKWNVIKVWIWNIEAQVTQVSSSQIARLSCNYMETRII